MKRPDSAMAVLKWKPGALRLLRAYATYDQSLIAERVTENMHLAAGALVPLMQHKMLTTPAPNARCAITALGRRALAWYDMETRAARPVKPDSEPSPDGPAPLNFDAPRHLPAFAFGAGK